MKRSILRPLAIGVATLSTVAGLAIGAVSSQAAQIGTFTFSPASGIDANSLTLSSSTACPGGTNYQIAVTGTGFPVDGYNVTANNSQSILPTNAAGGYDVGLLDTMKAFALAQTPPATLSGDYVFTGTCKNAFGVTTFGTHVGTLTFTQNGANPPSFVTKQVLQNYTTSTALASSPASPVDTGVAVTFTAAVTSTPAGGATGTVQLLDGTTAVGSPTAVDASGMAVITTSFATAGSHSITAAFTGSAANVGNSASTPIVYTVNQSPATPTTTSLAISPASATSADNVTLTANVAPAGAAGKVQFADGATNLGNPVTVSAGGTAALTQTFAEGAHSFTASFVPTNAASFASSASTSQAYTVLHFAGAQTSEKIETTIAAGALTISVFDTSTVVLPSPVLNADASFLTTAGALHPVTVTDTRAGNPGWVVSGQVSDFQNTTGPTTTPIAGVNLGWTPNVVDKNPGQTIVPGAAVLPATPALAVNPAVAGAAGLQVSRTLASAAAGAGTGTAHLGADLALNVPTTVVAGTYDATLTLTAI
ncbi:MAG: hypothetical protein QOJ11_4293 [Frankiales bacterium]|jgi:hypothetical protein|nr:hypothetical protein [Frankiales bacterium]